MRVLLHGTDILPAPPAMEGEAIEPVVSLPGGLKMDDRVFSRPTMILGGVGSGKTVLLKSIMDGVLAEQEKTQDNAVIFCAKKDLLKYKRKDDIVVSVEETELSGCWNIFLELEEATHPELIIRELGESLFAELKSSYQPFFYNAAKMIFQQSLLFLHAINKKLDLNLDNTDLYNFLTSKPIGSRAKASICSDNLSNADNTNDLGDLGDLEAYDNNGKVDPFKLSWFGLSREFPEYFGPVAELLGQETSEQPYAILSEITNMCHKYFFGSFCSEQGELSVLRTLKQRGKRILFYYDYMTAKSCRELFRVLLDLCFQQSMAEANLDNNRRCWYFLEEASVLPKLENLQALLSYGREFGVRILFVLQSALLLNKGYKEEEARALLSLFQNVFIYQTGDSFTRQYGIQNRFGKAYYMIRGEGPWLKESEQVICDDVVSDAVLAELVKPGDCLVSMPGLSPKPFYYRGHGKYKKK